MPAHIAHPAADALFEACGMAEWAHASRHWRALPLFARDALALPALLCSMEALRGLGRKADIGAADGALRALAATAVDSRASTLNGETARSLSADFCGLGLGECFAELDRSPMARHAGAPYEDCLRRWASLYFPSDAKSFLVRFTSHDLRSGQETLRRLCQWAGPAERDSLERLAATCLRASIRFWPDGRESMAERAGALAADRLAELDSTLCVPGDEPLADATPSPRAPRPAFR